MVNQLMPRRARQLKSTQRHLFHALGILLMPTLVLAQDAAPSADSSVPEVATASVAIHSDSSTAPVPVALQTAPSEQYSLPAGVCPVITDYLYQQCQQNPDDAMCAPATTTE